MSSRLSKMTSAYVVELRLSIAALVVVATGVVAGLLWNPAVFYQEDVVFAVLGLAGYLMLGALVAIAVTSTIVRMRGLRTVSDVILATMVGNAGPLLVGAIVAVFYVLQGLPSGALPLTVGGVGTIVFFVVLLRLR